MSCYRGSNDATVIQAFININLFTFVVVEKSSVPSDSGIQQHVCKRASTGFQYLYKAYSLSFQLEAMIVSSCSLTEIRHEI